MKNPGQSGSRAAPNGGRDQDTGWARAIALRSQRVARTAAAALAGILAAAVALGVAELAAALIGPNSAPVIAVGETAINLTPIGVKEFAIAHFGSHDKEALIAGILVLLAGFAALIGVLAVRRIGYGLAGLVVFAGLASAAALHLPGAGLADVVPTLAGVAVAAAALAVLAPAALPAVSRRQPRARSRPAGPTQAVPAPGVARAGGRSWPRSWPRRAPRRRWRRWPAGAATCCCGGSASPRPGRRSGCPPRPCAPAPYRPAPN